MMDNVKIYKGPSFPLQTVLELSCAAQRYNKAYIKMAEPVMDTEGTKIMYYRHPNRTLMLVAIGEDKTTYQDRANLPALISTNLADKELATEIQKYFRKLMFAAINGENEFQTELNSLLNSTEVPLNKLGFIACLPSVYARDFATTQMEKRIKDIDPGFLANIEDWILDKDTEIIKCSPSKNYDAWNIDAIIDNKLVSWMSKVELKLGPCVVIKGRVKGTNTHWQHPNLGVTRLNYVRAAQ